MEFLAAVGALVEHLVKALRALGIFGEGACGFLPGEVIILEGLDDAVVYLIYGQIFHLLGGEEERVIGLRVDLAVVEVPEGGVHVVAVGDEGDHGNLEHLAELAQSRRKHGRGAAEGIASLRINHGDIPVADNLGKLADKDGIVGEFSLTYATYGPQEPLPADESVNGHYIVGLVRINHLRCNLEVHEGVVVAEEKVRRLQRNVHTVEMDCGPMGNHVRPAQEFGNRLQVPLGPDGVPGHVKALEGFFHASCNLISSRFSSGP